MQGDEASQVRRWLGATGFSEELEVERTTPEGAGFRRAVRSRRGRGAGCVPLRQWGRVRPADHGLRDRILGRSTDRHSARRERHLGNSRTAVGHREYSKLGPRSPTPSVRNPGTNTSQRCSPTANQPKPRWPSCGTKVWEVTTWASRCTAPVRSRSKRDEEVLLGSQAVVGTAAGASVGVLAGMALTALVIPGLAPLGVAGLFAVGAATGFGGAMLGGYLGIAAADEAFTAHGEIRETPLEPGEVLVTVLAHGEGGTVESVMQRNSGTLLTLKPSIP